MESFFKQQRGPSVSITLDLGLLEAGTMLALLNHIITNSLILHGFLILIHWRKKKKQLSIPDKYNRFIYNKIESEKS